MYQPVMILSGNFLSVTYVSRLTRVMEMTVGKTAKKILYIP
jgi:hypothetical protein